MSGGEVILLLIGPTGSGKTSFIKHATGLSVDTSCTSCVPTPFFFFVCVSKGAMAADNIFQATTRCRVYGPTTPVGPTRFWIIDTPGLDDLPAENLGVIKDIAQTLANLAPREVGGAIFFHRITEGRFSGSARVHLEIFKQICGAGFADHAVFITTMWNRPGDKEKFNIIQRQLKDKYFYLNAQSRAPVFGFANDGSSGKKVLEYFAKINSRGKPTPLQFSQEVKRSGLSLSSVRRTSAGREIMKSSDKKSCVIL